MKTSSISPAGTREWVKLVTVVVLLGGLGGLLWLTPALHMPLLLSSVFTLLLSPWVNMFQRLGYPKIVSIAGIFLIMGALGTVLTVNVSQTLMQQWDSLSRDTPRYLEQTTEKLFKLERTIKNRYSVLENVTLVDSFIRFGKDTVLWSVQNIPSLLGELLTWIFLVPIFVFAFLKDGDEIRKRIFQLVPNRYFESTFMITTQVANSTSDYLRAKLVEALLVGLLTGAGLWMIGAPYSLVLGVVAGVTNIVPYLGPIIGAVPGIVLTLSDPATAAYIWPTVIVYLTVNAIDMIVIFPLIVGKLVDLHPIALIVVVMLGQQFYGILGMLLSVPLAAALKILIREIYAVIYDPINPS